MDWFSVVLWSLIAFVALPLGLGAIAHLLLGAQALVVLGGLTLEVPLVVVAGLLMLALASGLLTFS